MGADRGGVRKDRGRDDVFSTRTKWAVVRSAGKGVQFTGGAARTAPRGWPEKRWLNQKPVKICK